MLALVLAAAVVTQPPLVPGRPREVPGDALLIPGYVLSTVGMSVALLGGFVAALYAVTPRNCGIDPCARIGGNDAGWITLALGLGAWLLLGMPAIGEGLRERITAANER
jgi:hypothetical protein